MTLKFRIVPRTLDGQIVLYAVVNVTTYQGDPERVTLNVVSGTHGNAEFTTTMAVYRSLRIGHFRLCDECSDSLIDPTTAN